MRYTSSDGFCGLCHVHPHAAYSWKRSTHFKNKSGIVVHCVDCHLPPGGIRHVAEKVRLGSRDIYSTLFRNTGTIDWEAKSVFEKARTYTYDTSCMECHTDLFSPELSSKGVEAHEHYLKMKNIVPCIRCHMTVGHFQETPVLASESIPKEVIDMRNRRSTDDRGFADYNEVLPGTDLTFGMIAVKGGTFLMGSPESEPFHKADEGPVHEVTVSSFWMGEAEVTWREYEVYYNQTTHRKSIREGAAGSQTIPAHADSAGSSLTDTTAVADAVTGPTPPYTSPADLWSPAYGMTYFAAEKYCEWLSKVTGKKYRLPTEAEWEYACRAGTTGPYFFEGDPKKLTRKTWRNRLFGTDAGILNIYVFYSGNSSGKPRNPYTNEPNPWGLYNMYGNVKEFCQDWYAPDTYSTYPWNEPIINPGGPAAGRERVIRGGSYNSDPSDFRAASRSSTHHNEWLISDPRPRKSIWWYSDSRDVGFRVVREYEGERQTGE